MKKFLMRIALITGTIIITRPLWDMAVYAYGPMAVLRIGAAMLAIGISVWVFRRVTRTHKPN